MRCIFSGLTPNGQIKNYNNTYNGFKNTIFSPILSSKRYYSFNEDDEKIIKELREFIKNTLSIPKSIFYYKETTLDKRLFNKENDTIVQIIYKTELNDIFIYYVQDDTDVCELHSFKYFDFIKINDVIRVRNYKFNEKNILTTNNFSNILIIPKHLGYYNEFLDKIKKKKENLINNFYDKNKKFLGKKINRNNLNDLFNKDNDNSKFNNFYKRLNDYDAEGGNNIFNEELQKEKYNYYFNKNYLDLEEEEKEDKKIILTAIKEEREINPNEKEINPDKNKSKSLSEYELIEVQIIKYHPQNLKKCVKYFCPQCKKIFPLEENSSIDPNNKIYCTKCRKDFYPNFYYQMVFECIENPKSNKILILHLCTFDGEGESFFGIMPTNFNIAKEQEIKLKKFLENLIENKGYVRVYVNRKSYINKNQKNTLCRIVGNYTNKI